MALAAARAAGADDFHPGDLQHHHRLAVVSRTAASREIYWVLGWGRWLLVGVVGVLFFLRGVRQRLPGFAPHRGSAWFALNHRLREQSLNILDRTLRRVVFWGSAIFIFFFALSLGSGAASSWPQFLLFLHAHPTGTLDPILHHDLSFYLFRLPVFEMVSTWLTFTVLVALIDDGGGLPGHRRYPPGARDAGVLARGADAPLHPARASFFLAKALGYYIGRFSLLSMQTGAFVGPGYTDVHARIPDLLIMTVVALFAALLMFINLRGAVSSCR